MQVYKRSAQLNETSDSKGECIISKEIDLFLNDTDEFTYYMKKLFEMNEEVDGYFNKMSVCFKIHKLINTHIEEIFGKNGINKWIGFVCETYIKTLEFMDDLNQLNLSQLSNNEKTLVKKFTNEIQKTHRLMLKIITNYDFDNNQNFMSLTNYNAYLFAKSSILSFRPRRNVKYVNYSEH